MLKYATHLFLLAISDEVLSDCYSAYYVMLSYIGIKTFTFTVPSGGKISAFQIFGIADIFHQLSQQIQEKEVIQKNEYSISEV